MKFLARHRNPLAAALLLLPVAAPAQAPKPGAAPPRKFEIRLLVTAELDKVVRPTKGPDGKLVQAEPLKLAPRGQQFAVVVFFKDCQPDSAGNCKADVDFQGIDPRGKTFEDRKGSPLWRVKAPGQGLAQLGSSVMKIELESSDPAGTWRVIVVAHDRVSGAQARAEASFDVR